MGSKGRVRLDAIQMVGPNTSDVEIGKTRLWVDFPVVGGDQPKYSFAIDQELEDVYKALDTMR